jgi:hypothetical protein
MDDNEYDTATEFKYVSGSGNLDSRKRPVAQTQKKGWGDEDDDKTADFLEKHNTQVAAELEVKAAENKKKEEDDARRNKNLAKYKGNGLLASTKMATSKTDLPLTQPVQPVKFTNKSIQDGANKFKKGPEQANGQPTVPVHVVEAPVHKGEVNIIKKDQKVKLGGHEEQRFEEERRLAQAKKEQLERDAEEERQAKEELKRQKLGNVQKAADKFRPQKRDDTAHHVEVQVNGLKNGQSVPDIPKKEATKIEASTEVKKEVEKKAQTSSPVHVEQPKEVKKVPTKHKRWSDED